MGVGLQSVDEYIASQPKATQAMLRRVRMAIRDAVPAAEEVISYKIPTYKLQGTAILYFAGWKRFYSLYPASKRLLAKFKEDLAPFEVNKSTLRFPFTQPVPVKLIASIAKFRVQEVAGRS